MEKLLYIDSCVNRETSRTERLAQTLLSRLEGEGRFLQETLVLEDELAAGRLRPLTGELVLARTAGTEAGDFSHPVFAYAKQFAAADVVVFAAPFWDFSFPSMLKVYLELLCAQGVTFDYSPQGVPTGLVRTRKAYYVTTAGGYVGERDYGIAQVEAICKLYFGIPEVVGLKAEGLDIVTNDVEAIMAQALREVGEMTLSSC